MRSEVSDRAHDEFVVHRADRHVKGETVEVQSGNDPVDLLCDIVGTTDIERTIHAQGVLIGRSRVSSPAPFGADPAHGEFDRGEKGLDRFLVIEVDIAVGMYAYEGITDVVTVRNEFPSVEVDERFEADGFASDDREK